MLLVDTADRNEFLAKLPRTLAAALKPLLAPMTLRAGTYLYRVGDTLSDVVFPQSGLVVMRVPAQSGSGGSGVTLIGRDGIVGGFVSAASVPATCDAGVLVGGQACRISAANFRELLETNASVRGLAAKFSAAMMAQAQHAALCGGNHSVDERLSRSLLEIADRTGSANLPLTQSDLARMLGVQRTTINLVIGKLESAGALSSRRCNITIVDRAMLERQCCECYGRVRNYTARVFAEDSDDAVPANDPGQANLPQTVL